MATANRTGEYNGCSYVILYSTANRRIVFGGDSHDRTWEFILQEYSQDVTDVDLLIAPHQGSKSGRSYEFLNTLRPALTLFGNARSKHLAYGPWNHRNLPFITSNQANCIVADIDNASMNIFVTNETFAKAENETTYYDESSKGWYICSIEQMLKRKRTFSQFGGQGMVISRDEPHRLLWTL